MTTALGACTPISRNKDGTHIISAVILARVLYSASVLDHETVGCFLVLYKTRLQPKNMGKPPIDLLSSEQLAQSASPKPLTIID
jgi:hypothetical protein